MSDNINGFPVPEEPETREEQYLSAIAQVTPATQIPPKPLTRIEAYLNEIVENGGGGGGGGTTNYNALENKPQINSHELSGNKSSSDLGLQAALSEAQQAAVDSGIDSTKVEQIETNKTNISFVENSIFEERDMGTDISKIANITKKTGASGRAYNSATEHYIIVENNANYDTYYIVTAKNVDIYVDDEFPAYFAICYGENYSSTEEAQGGTRLYCDTPSRVRNTDNNLPTVNNKLSLPANSVIAFTVTAGKTTLIYGIDEQTIIVKGTFKKQVNSKIYIQYHSGSGSDLSSEWVNIYAPSTEGFVKYELVHTVSNNRNADIWRVAKAVKCDENFTDISALTVAGEWEIAVKLDGRSDFSGGYMHGDEKYTDAIFFVNGKETDISTIIALTAVDRFSFIEKSNLYDANDSTTVIAIHGSNHIFTPDKLTIEQSLVWKTTETVIKAYMSMFPIAKNISSKLVTNDTYSVISLPQNVEKTDITDAIIYSEQFYSSFNINNYPVTKSSADNKFICTDNGGQDYNKCYYATVTNTYTPQIDETWKITSNYVLITG